MRGWFAPILVGAAMLSPALFMTGCEKTVAERDKTTRTWTGDTKTESTKVKESPTGERSVEHETHQTNQ